MARAPDFAVFTIHPQTRTMLLLFGVWRVSLLEAQGLALGLKGRGK